MIEIFDEIALEAILVYFPAYKRIHSEVHVRIADLPLSSTLRDLRRANLNNLVRVSGVVTRRTGVFPQLKYVKFDCRKCGAVLGPFFQDATKEVRISYCANCEGKGPFTVNSEQVCRFSCSWILIWLICVHEDCISKLPEDDAPGVPWICSCGSIAKAS
jgi:DNA replication licensing factor MCM2